MSEGEVVLTAGAAILGLLVVLALKGNRPAPVGMQS